MRLALALGIAFAAGIVGNKADAVECGMAFNLTGPEQTSIWSANAGVASFYFHSNSDVDADGSGRAYHPDDIAANQGLAQDSLCDGVDRLVDGAKLSCTDASGDCQKCLDHFRSVPKPEMIDRFGDFFSAFGIATSGKKACLVEQGPNNGFFVSPSSYQDKSKGLCETARYIDANVFPAIAVPTSLVNHGVAMGDLVVVRNRKNGRTGFGIVYDGSGGSIGESSVMMNRVLSCDRTKPGCEMPPTPTRLKETNALQLDDVAYLIFSGTAGAFPTSPDDVAADAQAKFATWGGAERLAACDAAYSK